MHRLARATATIVAITTLAACGAEPAPGDQREPGPPVTDVVLWHSYRGTELTVLDATVARFNATHPDVRIRAQAIPYDPFVDKVTISVPRGQGPDLFIFAHNTIGTWVEKGVLAPLSQVVDHATLSEFLPASVKALVYRKNLYGLPLTFKSLVMFYDKALLPDPPDTMEALIEAVKPLQIPGKRFGIVYQAGGLYFHAMWVHAFGGAIFDTLHRPALDTPEQAAALSFARALNFDHGVLPRGVTGFMVTSLFNEGNAAVVFNGPWFTSEIKGVDYGMRPIPTVNGKAPAPLMGIEAVFIAKTSPHQAAALEAALYLAGADAARARMRDAHQPVCHAAVLAEGAASDPAMKVYQAQAEHSVPIDSSPDMQLVWTAADAAIASGIFVQDADPKAELAKAQAKIVDDLSKAEKPR